MPWKAWQKVAEVCLYTGATSTPNQVDSRISRRCHPIHDKRIMLAYFGPRTVVFWNMGVWRIYSLTKLYPITFLHATSVNNWWLCFFVDREIMRMVMGMSDEDDFLIIYYWRWGSGWWWWWWWWWWWCWWWWWWWWWRWQWRWWWWLW